MRTLRNRQHADRCLGDKAAALADGELGTDARDAALAHLVHCDGCRDDVAGQRRLKARLGDLTEPSIPASLLERLSAMSSLRGLDDVDSDDFGGFDRGLGLMPDSAPIPGRRHRVRLSSRSARRGVRYAMAGGASVIALGVSAFALGGQSAPTVVPQVDNFTIEHASTTGEIPVSVLPPAVSYRPVLVGTRR